MLWTYAEERLEIQWTKDAECGDANQEQSTEEIYGYSEKDDEEGWCDSDGC